MKHLGDITKIKGNEAPLVDIICGGSPCQDLSIAGKREGLSGERSGLFMEQIRIVKEMRNESIRQLQLRGADVDFRYIRPRYMVWENVPGAFSSNKGEDFRCVLEEICRVADKTANVPMPEKGKWSTSGVIMGESWSVAWRVHDAQFWGVPQRRKRISLVADFNGESAPKILFESKGLSGDIEESREKGQGTTTDIERGSDKAISFQERAGKEGGGKGILIQNERTGALSTLNNQSVFCIQGNCIDRADTAGCNGKGWREDQCYTLNTIDRPAVCAIESHPQDSRVKINEDEVNQPLSANMCHDPSNGGLVLSLENQTNVLNVEMEVQKRKYVVDIKALIQCLQEHRKMPISEIAKKLNKPKTMVEHWFRKDKCFSIPDADIWMDLKRLLEIETDKFDKAIMTFETDGGNYDIRNRIHIGEKAPTLTASSENNLHLLLENHPADSRVKISENGVVQTLSSRMGTGGGNIPMVMEKSLYSIGHDIRSAKFTDDEITDPLTATDYKDPIKINDCRQTYQNITGTLDCGITKGTGNQLVSQDMYVANQSVVRRLTPLECERLQGYPDGWTDIGEWVDSKGKKHKDSDSPRYKALGNSIALPFWQWMAERMIKELNVEHPTMASLFDGISGFCLVYKRCDCEPVWTSEVEEFPIAVCKRHFGDEATGERGDIDECL